MRIGICTTDFNDALSADELFALVKRLGFSAVQLAFSSVSECEYNVSEQIEIPESVSAKAVSAIRTAADKHGVAICAVNGTFNMAHPDRAVREEGLRRFEGFLNGVNDVGCKLVSVCSGSRSRSGLWTYDPATSLNDAYVDMIAAMKRAVKLAESKGIVLAVETEAANVIDSPEIARRALDEIASPNLKMILDCANLFHAGEAVSDNVRPAIDRAIKFFGNEIVLAHGKDIREGSNIDFCGTGFGIVDFPYMLERLNDAGFLGDMMLHGIYKMDDIPGCLAFMRECFKKVGVRETLA